MYSYVHFHTIKGVLAYLVCFPTEMTFTSLSVVSEHVSLDHVSMLSHEVTDITDTFRMGFLQHKQWDPIQKS